MANTKYDEVYQLFIDNVWVEGIDLPQTPEQIYNTIHNAVKLYNNRLRDSVTCDDTNEQFDRQLNDDQMLIMAHYLRLTLLKNNRTYKNAIFDTFTKEVGYKNIKAQLDSLDEEIKNEEKTIDFIIFNADESVIM